MELGEMAESLEMAGKENDIPYIRENHEKPWRIIWASGKSWHAGICGRKRQAGRGCR